MIGVDSTPAQDIGIVAQGSNTGVGNAFVGHTLVGSKVAATWESWVGPGEKPLPGKLGDLRQIGNLLAEVYTRVVEFGRTSLVRCILVVPGGVWAYFYGHFFQFFIDFTNV